MTLPGRARLGDALKALTGLFKSDHDARQQVLEILGSCGVLQPKSRPLVTGRFFFLDKDQFHPHFHTRDWAYPVSWWTGADGVNEHAVEFWFPKLAEFASIRVEWQASFWKLDKGPHGSSGAAR